MMIRWAVFKTERMQMFDRNTGALISEDVQTHWLTSSKYGRGTWSTMKRAALFSRKMDAIAQALIHDGAVQKLGIDGNKVLKL